MHESFCFFLVSCYCKHCAVKILVCKSLCVWIHFSELWVVEFEHLQVGSSLTVSIQGCTDLNPTISMWESPNPTSPPTFIMRLFFFFFAILMGVKRHFTADLIFISVADRIKYLSLCLLDIRVFSLPSIYLYPLPFKKLDCLSFLYCCEVVLYPFWCGLFAS